MASRIFRHRHRGASAAPSIGSVCLSIAATALSMTSACATTTGHAPATPATRLAQCSWDRPGHDPFMGDVVAAVDRYTDIAPDVRARLKQRMALRNYDDIAVIGRDAIAGRSQYDTAIRDMHFGTGRICGSVSRAAWAPTQQERGLVYCEGNECIVVPTVCRNVSRIRRHGPAAAALPRDLLVASDSNPGAELIFDAPGAGLPAEAAPLVVFTSADLATASGFGVTRGGGGGVGGGGVGGGGGSSSGSIGSAGAAPGGAYSASPDSSFSAGVAAVPGATIARAGASAGAGGLEPAAANDVFGERRPAVAVVPEPSTWALLALGLAFCAMRRKRTAAMPR
jgi:PEP-CTERM motif